MAHYGKTDAHGNPVHHTGGYGTTGGAGTGVIGGLTNKIKAMLPGGRRPAQASHITRTGHRKKGIVERITDMLPGGRKLMQASHPTGTATTPIGHGYAGGHQHQQNKGVVEKITEKLPGQHNY